MNTKMVTWLPTIALLVAVVLWGSSFAAMKFAFGYYDPMVVIFGRMAIASLCFLFLMKKMIKFEYRKGDIKLIVFMAFCEPCLYFALEAKALENTSASQAGMITSMMPLLVAVMAGFFLKERVSRKSMIGFFIAIAGTCWLSLGGEATKSAPNPVLGNFLEFLAMCAATGYTITLKRLTTRYSPFFLAGIQAFMGSIFFLPSLFFPSTVLPTTFEPAGVFTIIYLGVFITLGAYALYNFGVSRIPASQACAFANLIPVVGIVTGRILLGETFTISQYIASLVVLIGVVISQERKEKPAPIRQVPNPAVSS